MPEEKTTEQEKKPSWIKIKPSELEKIVIELAKKGHSPAQIGLILRDKHGIPKVRLLGKKITKILEDAKIDYKSEKEQITKKIENLKSHIAKNKHDYTASRSLTKQLWALHHLAKKQ
jgi:small subunit ribosomal protein S15